MPVSVTLLVIAGVFIACGVYMMLERTLSRIIMGFVLLGNGVNLLFLVAMGTPGKPPFEGEAQVSEMSDPLPMAMVLTAIVIALAMAGFGMALAYRAWQLFGHDEVPDDVEDRRVASRSRRRSAKAKRERARAASMEGHPGERSAGEGRPDEGPAGEADASHDDDDDDISTDLTSDEDVEADPTEGDPE